MATQIGLATEKITLTVAASLVAAGLLSAARFPAGAQRLLPRGPAALRRGGPNQEYVRRPWPGHRFLVRIRRPGA